MSVSDGDAGITADGQEVVFDGAWDVWQPVPDAGAEAG